MLLLWRLVDLSQHRHNDEQVEEDGVGISPRGQKSQRDLSPVDIRLPGLFRLGGLRRGALSRRRARGVPALRARGESPEVPSADAGDFLVVLGRGEANSGAARRQRVGASSGAGDGRGDESRRLSEQCENYNALEQCRRCHDDAGEEDQEAALFLFLFCVGCWVFVFWERSSPTSHQSHQVTRHTSHVTHARRLVKPESSFLAPFVRDHRGPGMHAQ